MAVFRPDNYTLRARQRDFAPWPSLSTLSQHFRIGAHVQFDLLRNLTLSIVEEVRRFVGTFSSGQLDERLGLLSVVFLSAWRSKG